MSIKPDDDTDPLMLRLKSAAVLAVTVYLASCASGLALRAPKKSHDGDPYVQECEKGSAAACWTAGMQLGRFKLKDAGTSLRPFFYFDSKRERRKASDRVTAFAMLRKGCDLGHAAACFVASKVAYKHQSKIFETPDQEAIKKLQTKLTKRSCSLGFPRACGETGPDAEPAQPIAAWHPEGAKRHENVVRGYDREKQAFLQCYREVGSKAGYKASGAPFEDLEKAANLTRGKGIWFYDQGKLRHVISLIPLLYGPSCADLPKHKKAHAELFERLLAAARKNAEDDTDLDLIPKDKRVRLIEMLEGIERRPEQWSSVAFDIRKVFATTKAIRDRRKATPVPPEVLVAKSWCLVIAEAPPKSAQCKGEQVDFWPSGNVTGGRKIYKEWKIASRQFFMGEGKDRRKRSEKWQHRFVKRASGTGPITLVGPFNKTMRSYLIETPPPAPMTMKQITQTLEQLQSGKLKSDLRGTGQLRFAKALRAQAEREVKEGRWGSAGLYMRLAGKLTCPTTLPAAEAKRIAANASVPRLKVIGAPTFAVDNSTSDSKRQATVEVGPPRFENLRSKIAQNSRVEYRTIKKTYDTCAVGSQCYANWERAVASQKWAVSHMESNQRKTYGGNATSTGLARYGQSGDLSGKTDTKWVKGRGVGSYTTSGYTPSDVTKAQGELDQLMANDPRKNPQRVTRTYDIKYEVREEWQLWQGDVVRDVTYSEPDQKKIKVVHREPLKAAFLAIKADSKNGVVGSSKHVTKQELQAKLAKGPKRDELLLVKGAIERSSRRGVEGVLATAKLREVEATMRALKPRWSSAQTKAEIPLRAAYLSGGAAGLPEAMARVLSGGPGRCGKKIW